MTTEFIVSDMTCNHCVQAITQAVHGVEPQASVNIDLAKHRVYIDNANDLSALEQAISEEGYDVKRA